MNLTHALSILIEGKNQSGPALAEAGAGVEKLAGAVTDAATKISLLSKIGKIGFGLLGGAVKVLLGLFMALGAGIAAVSTAFLGAAVSAEKYAEELNSAARAFESIAGESAPKLLSALRENSRYMLSDLRLQEQYVSAYMLVGETLANRLPEAYLYLSKVANATHDDLDFLVERMYRSVGRLSTRWMAYIGVVVEEEEATAHAAKMFDKAADALSREEIQAGMLDRTLEKLAARTAILPDALMSTEQLSKAVGTAFKNLTGTFGTIFLPAANSVYMTLLKVITVIESLIAKGGALYDFFRTISATVSVVFDALGKLADQFGNLDKTILDGLKNLGQKVLQTAWAAFSWGVNIATQLASGLISGAASAIVAAINFISSLLTFWFSPGSPPRVAPDIDKWGMETMYQFLKGFTMVSYDILEGVQGKLEGVLSAFVSLGTITGQEAAATFLDITDEMVRGMDIFKSTGNLTTSLYNKLMEVGEGFGKHLVELTTRQLDYSIAVERVETATKRLEAAQNELEASQKALAKTTDEYYMMLLTGGDYTTLKAKRAEKEIAESRYGSAKVALTAAEVEKAAAEAQTELLRERLDLQGKLIDQLTLLLQKQADLEEEAASGGGGGGGGPKAGGGGLEIPEIEMPGAGFAASVDDAFEELKERIRQKFLELWEQIKLNWEESGAGQALSDLKQALEDLDTKLGIIGPKISESFRRITKPLRDWAIDDVWAKSLEELDAWKTWWETDGPVIIEALETLDNRMRRISAAESIDWSALVPEDKGLAGQLELVVEHLGEIWDDLQPILGGILLGVKWVVAFAQTIQSLVGLTFRTAITLVAEKIAGDTDAVEQTLLEFQTTAQEKLTEIGTTFASFATDLFGTNFMGKLDELGVLLGTWFEEHLMQPPAEADTQWGQKFGNMSMSVLTSFSTMLPVFVNIAAWLGIHLPKAGESLRKNQVDDVWPGIQGAVDTAWVTIVGWFEEMKTWFETTLVTALGTIKTAFEDKMRTITTAVSTAWQKVKDLKSAVEEFWNWLQGKEFKVKIKVEKPADLDTGSPLRIHSALIDLDDWLKKTQLNVRMDMPGISSNSIVGATNGSGQSAAQVYIEKLILQGVQDAPNLLRQIQEVAL